MAQPKTQRPGLMALLTGETLTAAQMAERGECPAEFIRVGDAAMNAYTRVYESVRPPEGCALILEEGLPPPLEGEPRHHLTPAGNAARPLRPIPPPRPVPAWARIGDRIIYVGMGAVALFFVLRTAVGLI
jgi:hypothetical protein